MTAVDLVCMKGFGVGRMGLVSLGPKLKVGMLCFRGLFIIKRVMVIRTKLCQLLKGGAKHCQSVDCVRIKRKKATFSHVLIVIVIES